MPRPRGRKSDAVAGAVALAARYLLEPLPLDVSVVCSGSSGCGTASTARFQLFSVNVTFFAPGYWIATVWPPLPSTVVWTTVLLIGTGVGLAAVEGRKLTLPVAWPSTRIAIGHAWSGPGFGAGMIPL